MPNKQTTLPLEEEPNGLERQIAYAFLRARRRYHGDIRKFYEDAMKRDPSNLAPVDDKLADLQHAASGNRERRAHPV